MIVAITQLPRGVRTPAFKGMVVEDCAGVIEASTDSEGCFGCAEVDGWQIFAHFVEIIASTISGIT